MFLLMFPIGLRRSLFPNLKPTPVTRDATAIGTRLACRVADITPSACPGWLTMSPSEISPAPTVCWVNWEYAPMPVDTLTVPRSDAPVIMPQGDVPATPSERMLAYV